MADRDLSFLHQPFSLDTLLKAYANGIFPMAESEDDPRLYWMQPETRGIFPLETFTVAKSLAKAVRRNDYEVRIDTDFEAVIKACATTHGRTWINEPIRIIYGRLFEAGCVHTVEVWREGKLIGGLYGLALGGAFFGESMFHTATNASKIALVHLVARLKVGGFTLLDAQYITPHLASLGAIEIPQDDYLKLLDKALEKQGDFYQLEPGISGAVALQLISHTS